jgi:hypothetical protein
VKAYAKREKAVMWEVYDAGCGTATMLDGRPPDELEEDETDEASSRRRGNWHLVMGANDGREPLT